MSVGVKKARAPYTLRGVDKPAPSVMATNSNPIGVAPADAAVLKKFSQPCSIGVLKKARRAIHYLAAAPVWPCPPTNACLVGLTAVLELRAAGRPDPGQCPKHVPILRSRKTLSRPGDR